MIDIISANIGMDHIFYCSRKIIARVGEHNVTKLEISLENELCEGNAYLDFKKSNGEKYRSQKLEIVDNVATYKIPRAVLNQEGELLVQLVIEKEGEATWESFVKKYYVQEAINAVDEIPVLEKESAFTLTDKISGKRYKIYVADGKLMMEAIK